MSEKKKLKGKSERILDARNRVDAAKFLCKGVQAKVLKCSFTCRFVESDHIRILQKKS